MEGWPGRATSQLELGFQLPEPGLALSAGSRKLDYVYSMYFVVAVVYVDLPW